MADVNRGNRPLSPFMIGQVYRPQITSVLSIIHRATGVAMAVSGALIVWWFIAAATGEDYFEFADGILTSWIGTLVMLGSLWALWYHFCNGLRHLWWDMGRGFELDQVTMSGIVTVVASLVLTVFTIIVVM
ncbi:succinate dehydrogenase, cytochrome b556 subunit [Paroceanicella profunda]|uniref:Succinate dehydrogenase cytochrome b556 subunit n=1 Tax=Paroceanicella profunda TaxID=2579971 RepID=A0A5B8FXY9_9RHOB|nr:succinate dehydrogenase, cytochrome b556 subunit [Paroceanicella profunda]QDL90963.1 succinate dehydrogenase, cytochrome b556 subunit [Paroceanicella profunda]